uniref:Eukaryotic translation initiation factor 3 subunit G N-terminal domain-containing protein n=1 Tax=Tanacetum cinerariifolium TaxID=118510 RepID=A0A6L2K9V0_TANCI|nr:hypothetical protein [Tanacetum cinerariifolium]
MARSTNTSDGLAITQAQLYNLGREIKKVNERVYVAQVGCKSCGRPHYTKDCPLKEEGKTLEEAYYSQYRVSFPQRGRYRAAALRFYQRDSGNPSKFKLQRMLLLETKKPRSKLWKFKSGKWAMYFKKGNLEVFLSQLKQTQEIMSSQSQLLLKLKHQLIDDCYKEKEEKSSRRLSPTIEDGEVIDKSMIEDTKTRNDDEEIEGIDEYPKIGVKAKQFDGMITIYDGNNDVNYQMAQSHPRCVISERVRVMSMGSLLCIGGGGGDLYLEEIEDEEVPLVDGVFEAAFGALGDESWCLGDGVLVSS